MALLAPNRYCRSYLASQAANRLAWASVARVVDSPIRSSRKSGHMELSSTNRPTRLGNIDRYIAPSRVPQEIPR